MEIKVGCSLKMNYEEFNSTSNFKAFKTELASSAGVSFGFIDKFKIVVTRIEYCESQDDECKDYCPGRVFIKLKPIGKTIREVALPCLGRKGHKTLRFGPIAVVDSPLYAHVQRMKNAN